MERHDAAHARAHGGTEGEELDAVQARRRRVDTCQLEMGVLLGVAMSRKVFPSSQHPVVLDAVNEGNAKLGDELWVFSERPKADDGVLRIVVDVEHGRERDVNAERPS